MSSITSRLPLLFAAVVLVGVAVLLVGGRLEYCGHSDASQSRIASSAPIGTPTLAPPQKVVFVQVEADKPDIEVGWADN